MSDPGDFSLHSGPRQEPPPDRPGQVWLWVSVAAIVLLFGAGAFWFLRPAPEETAPVATEGVATPSTTDEVSPVSGETLDLPRLDESDAFVRNLVTGLSSRPELATWLATEGLIRNVVVVVDNIAEGATPTKHLRVFAPKSGFRAAGPDDALLVDPRSYARYDALADAVDSVDTQGLVQTYRNLRPLFDQAYIDLGHPDGNFDVALQRAISHLLATPDPPADVRLTSHVRSYHYADPALESLSEAQKLLLRMGPRNARLVKDKLREILRVLGFEERQLP